MNLSVAAGDSHEGVTAILLAFLVLWDVFLQFLEEVEGLLVGSSDLVGDLLLFDASQGGVHVESSLSDWDGSFDDVPKDTLIAWGSGEGAGVSPSLIEVDLTDELLEVQVHTSLLGWILNQFDQESVVPLNLGLWISSMHFFEILLWHDLEEESENTGSELRVIMFPLSVEEMDDVHLHIKELTVDGVLSWGVEMELSAVKGSDWDMWVEEGDGFGLEAVGVFALRLTLCNIDKESVADLVELELIGILVDRFVVEVKLFVLEILMHWQRGAEVNRGLLLSKVAYDTTVGGLLLFHLDFWSNHEIDTWSLADVVSESLGIIVLESMDSVWLLSFIIILIESALLEVDVLHGETACLLDFFIGPLNL